MDWEAFYNRFRTPDFIPGYEIQNRLGGGAFGEVYKARKHSIGKPYAIKFLKIDDDAQREAVERELEQVRHFAAIDHPNLVTIEDLGTVEGVPYLIMGYAGEDTLARVLRAGGLDPEGALAYFVQACRGVLALHDRRLVHFDLKPSNIFLKGEIARVGDYGLSKMITDGRMTLSFGRGTPFYMAPEIIRNRADHRADIYSLGVILYESVAGKLPFESAVPGTLAVREHDVPPVFPPQFPIALRPVVERCLRLAPDDRYGSVAELLLDLGQTARPGDSIRFERGTAPTPRVDAGRTPPTPVTQPTIATPRGGEARQTAAELTRGAVEVARGVWDGLRSTTGPAPKTTRTPSIEASERTPTPVTPVPSATGDEGGIVMHTLSDGARASASAFDPPARPSHPGPRAASTLGPLTGSSFGTVGGTIPVPPPAEGGWLGTFAATFQLALEMLVALLRGLGRRVVVGWRARGARRRAQSGVVARSRSVIGGLLRLVFFCVLLALLGALTVTVVFYLLQGAR